MPRTPSLDEFIAEVAGQFAENVKNATDLAHTEEDVRIEVERQLGFIQREAGVELEELHGHHEVTVAKGRIDSLYSRVLIEYKNPTDSSARLGPRLESPGSRKVVEQIKSRFRGLKDEHGHQLTSLFGVGFDGRYFIFVRFRDAKWDVQEPVELSKYSSERFLWALYNLGQKGKPFSPEYLAADFGAVEGSVAIQGIHALYEAIANTDHPKAQTFFKQWKILFGEVCGYDVENPSDKIKKLAKFYQLPTEGLKAAELLFALHTYYALFMKLLASEIVAFFHRLPTPLKAMLSAGSSAQLKREMEKLEAGGIFAHLNITNFLEGDLFAWYTGVWSETIESVVRRLVATLDDYNPGTMSEDPATSRDLLKRMYQQLFPKSVRHDLGEYYTPDWLADHVLNEVGYVGDPDKRLLDPACGSGTFLVMAINRIKSWFDENRERCSYDEGDLCAKILGNVVGFELNPLAVMAARTNYLIAIRALIGHSDKIEIPVYLCDSILTPISYGGLFAGEKLGKARELRTAAAKFLVPSEISGNQRDIGKYAEQLEFCVRNGYNSEEFLERCREEGLPVEARTLHTDLYHELVKLDKENKNGVWARIIKNSFAPLFTGTVDFVVGNPPWINWESLPSEYRESTKDLWDKYRLRQRATPGARLGNVKKELSVLFVYVGLDYYAGPHCKLGFVITQSIFKTGANEGFRRFSLGPDKPFAVDRVSDLSLLLPFENAVNRTAVMIATKGEESRYPVSYPLWVPDAPRSYVAERELAEVKRDYDIQDWLAEPVEPNVVESTWLTGPAVCFPMLRRILGDRSDDMMERTYAGTCTWLNGVFWVESADTGTKRALIRNMANVGKKKVDQLTAVVDDEFLYPLLRGRDVHAWSAKPSALILVPHSRADFGKPVGLSEMKRKHPRTFDYFKRFEESLRSRSGYRQLLKSRPEFYAIGNIGSYTLAPYKVVFKDLTDVFQCAVVGPSEIEGSEIKPVIPDHTVLFIACVSQDEASFVAGVLNSFPVRAALYSASIGVQTQRYFPTDVSRVQLPEFDRRNDDHESIVKLATKCASRVSPANRLGHLTAEEDDLGELVAKLWRISRKDLKLLKDYYIEILSFRKHVDVDEIVEREE